MWNRQESAYSNSNPASEEENHDDINQTENITESIQDQTPLEKNTNQTEITQHNTQEIQSPSHSDIFIEQIQNAPFESQIEFSEVFSLKQAYAENESLKLQQQKNLSCKTIITTIRTGTQSCKTVITKTRTGTQSIVKTIESTKYCCSR